MHKSMWLRIEAVGISIGLVGVALLLVEIFFWSSFSDEVHQLFYGGEPGAFITGFFIIIGLLCSLLFLINIAFKRFSLWWLRLLGVMALYFGIAVIGASGI